jgi:hypothetical protein
MRMHGGLIQLRARVLSHVLLTIVSMLDAVLTGAPSSSDSKFNPLASVLHLLLGLVAGAPRLRWALDGLAHSWQIEGCGPVYHQVFCCCLFCL